MVPDAQVPYAYQGSLGFQRQLAAAAVVEADYVYTGTRHDSGGGNANLTYDPATGTNLFTFLAARAVGSFDNLNCADTGITDPITLTLDGNGVATAATTAAVGAPAPPATAPSPTTPAVGMATATVIERV